MKRLYFFLLLASVSCQTDDLLEEGTVIDSETRVAMSPEAKGNGFITIGEKLDNPLTVENMKEALADLKARGPINLRNRAMTRAVAGELNSLGEIKATHHYVKFSPQSLEELYLLREDTTLFCSPVPFDHEIIGEGILPYVPADFDPETWEITLNAPISPLYAYVPVTMSFPADINYEILDELYIPDAIDDEIAATADVQPLSDELARMLTNRSVSIGDGIVDPIQAAPWYPSGKIQVYDTELKRYVGVQSVRVRARSPRGTHDWEYTDKDGNFKFKTGFIGQAQYSIEWGSRDYEIQNAADQQATYYGARKTGSWALNIYDGESRGYATVARALSTHFFGNNIWGRVSDHKTAPLRIRYRHEYNKDVAGYFHYDPFRSCFNLY